MTSRDVQLSGLCYDAFTVWPYCRSAMSREQASISELLLSLDSSELQEAERARAAVNQQLSTGEFSSTNE